MEIEGLVTSDDASFGDSDLTSSSDRFSMTSRDVESPLMMDPHLSSSPPPGPPPLPSTPPPAADGVEKRERKVVYKVTLQPRFSDSDLLPAIPAQYLELFERLQPKIIAQGLASEDESLRTLNRSLRPKTRPNSTGDGKHPDGKEPLRMLGGRRMPPVEKQATPWSVKSARAPASNCVDTTPGTSVRAHGYPFDYSSKSGMSESEEEVQGAARRRMSFGEITGRLDGSRSRLDTPSHRPRSATVSNRNLSDSKAKLEVSYRSGSGSGRSPLPVVSPTSYRAYSQQIINTARKLTGFSPNDSDNSHQEKEESPASQGSGWHARSMSVDESGVSGYYDFRSAPATAWPGSIFAPSFPVPDSPIQNPDDRMFPLSPGSIRGPRLQGSFQERHRTSSSASASSASASTTSEDRTFDPVDLRNSGNRGDPESDSRAWNTRPTRADQRRSGSEATVTSPGVEELFRKMACNINTASTTSTSLDCPDPIRRDRPQSDWGSARDAGDYLRSTRMPVATSDNRVGAETSGQELDEVESDGLELEPSLTTSSLFQSEFTAGTDDSYSDEEPFPAGKDSVEDSAKDCVEDSVEDSAEDNTEDIAEDVERDLRFVSKVTVLLQRSRDQPSNCCDHRRIKQFPFVQLNTISEANWVQLTHSECPEDSNRLEVSTIQMGAENLHGIAKSQT